MAKLRHYFEDPFLRELDSSTAERVSNHFDDMLVVVLRNNAWHVAEHLWRLKHESAELFRLKIGVDGLHDGAGRTAPY